MAGDALSRVGENIATDVRIDGELVASHQHLPDAHLFPDLQDLMEALNKRISG